MFVFGPCFFSFFCLCCCDLGLSFWLLDLCSQLLGLIWENTKNSGSVFMFGLCFFSFFFFICVVVI